MYVLKFTIIYGISDLSSSDEKLEGTLLTLNKQNIVVSGFSVELGLGTRDFT